MSSNHVPPPEEPLLESAQEEELTEAVASALPSLTAGVVTTWDPHNAATAAAGVSSSSQNDSPGASTAEVDFDEILEIGKRYIRSPSSGREWLKGFEPLSPGTDVSLRFLSTKHV